METFNHALIYAHVLSISTALFLATNCRLLVFPDASYTSYTFRQVYKTISFYHVSFKYPTFIQMYKQYLGVSYLGHQPKKHARVIDKLLSKVRETQIQADFKYISP